MTERKPRAGTYVVRTDTVIAKSGPAFYGDKVKLSADEAKPLLAEGKVSKA
jgi:hypothetical protein